MKDVFKSLLRLDVGHSVLLLEQILFNITTTGFLQLSDSEASYLSL